MLPEDLATCEGRYPVAIGYLSVFWPSFVEHDGTVFRDEEVDEASVSSWLTTTGGNKQAVEATLSHFHILHLQHKHPGIWKDATEAQFAVHRGNASGSLGGETGARFSNEAVCGGAHRGNKRKAGGLSTSFLPVLLGSYGGERGIRTLDRVSPIHAFQACAFNHSAISPGSKRAREKRSRNSV
jgi:uncharacterized membrane protein